MVLPALAQEPSCPDYDKYKDLNAPKPSSLHGTIQFHDEIRQWLGVKLDKPTCNESEIQLVTAKSDGYRQMKTFVGCTVSVTGVLFQGATGYYSTKLAIDPDIKPEAGCRRSALEPDPLTIPIPATLRNYQVSITVDYRGEGHVDFSAWSSSNPRQRLKPWQTYIHYAMTGGNDSIFFGCHKGFTVTDIRQDGKSALELLKNEDRVGDMPRAWLNQDQGLNTFTYICRRSK